ncbi:MAG: hypothetical protein ABIW19_14580 [Vicinamibacterales bacterium]
MAVVSLVAHLSAKSAEFEKTFAKASSTAAQFEKQYGALASSVTAHQARINKAFQSFSGDKVIAEAHAYAAAIKQVGTVANLTESEQRRVNAAVTEAIAKYQALGQTAPKSLTDLAKATKALPAIQAPEAGKFNTVLGDITKQVGATAAGFISAQAIIGGVSTAFNVLTDFVGDSVQSFAAAEAAQKKLTAALTSQGTATPAVIKQFDDLAASFQRTTVYSDDLINEMQALLVQVGNVMPNEMRGALKASTDLASGLGIDLRTATLLVGKAFEGETGTLKKYGIVIDEAKLKAEGLPAVLEAINAKFGGQAASQIETYSGKVAQLTNDWDNFKESVGAAIVLDPSVIAALNLLTKGAQGASQAGGGGIAGFVDAAMGRSAGDAVRLLNAYSDSINKADKAARDAVALVTFPTIVQDSWKNAIPPSMAEQVRAIAKAFVPLTDEQKKAAEAAKQHADALQVIRDRLTGADLAVKVRDLSSAMRGLSAPDAMKRVAEQAGQLFDSGAKLTPEMIRLGIAFGTIGPKIVPLGPAFADLGTQAKLTAPELLQLNSAIENFQKDTISKLASGAQNLSFVFKTLPGSFEDLYPPVKKATVSLDAFARSFQQLGSIVGGSAGAFLGSVGDMIGGIDSIRKATEQYGKIANKTFADTAAFAATSVVSVAGIFQTLVNVVDGYGAASRLAAKQADAAMRDAFQSALTLAGSYGELKKRVEDLGFSWDRLSVAFVRSRGDLEAIGTAVRRAGTSIQDFNAAFANSPQGMAEANYKTREALTATALAARRVYEYMVETGRYSASEIARAFEASGTAQQAAFSNTSAAQLDAMSTLKGRIGELGSAFDSLNNSIRDEAPEEVMGIVEQQTRARMEAIKTEQTALQKQLEESLAASGSTAQKTAKEIEDALGQIRIPPIIVPYTFEPTNSPQFPHAVPRPFPALAHGGIVTRPTLALVGERGPEAVIPLSQYGRTSGGSNTNVTVMLDGEVIAKQLVKTGKRNGYY